LVCEEAIIVTKQVGLQLGPQLTVTESQLDRGPNPNHFQGFTCGLMHFDVFVYLFFNLFFSCITGARDFRDFRASFRANRVKCID
jgi:hypothetical protein